MPLKKDNFVLVTIIAVVCTVAMLVFGFSNSMFGYNLDDFNLWQLLTAHFMHYDWLHLFSNLSALGLLMYLFPNPRNEVVKAFVVAIILIDCYLYLAEVEYYVGFSGLLYAIPGLAFTKYILNGKYKKAVLIMLILVTYSWFSLETITISAQISWRSLLPAHLLGFVGGVLANSFSLNKLFKR